MCTAWCCYSCYPMLHHGHCSDEACILQCIFLTLHHILGTVQWSSCRTQRNAHVMQCSVITTAVMEHVYSNTSSSHCIVRLLLCNRQRVGIAIASSFTHVPQCLTPSSASELRDFLFLVTILPLTLRHERFLKYNCAKIEIVPLHTHCEVS